MALSVERRTGRGVGGAPCLWRHSVIWALSSATTWLKEGLQGHGSSSREELFVQQRPCKRERVSNIQGASRDLWTTPHGQGRHAEPRPMQAPSRPKRASWQEIRPHCRSSPYAGAAALTGRRGPGPSSAG